MENINNLIPDPIIYKNGFLKDENQMEESFREEDWFGLNSEIKDLLNFIIKMKNRNILGYIGEFGAGKSTILNQVKNDINPNNKGYWIQFEAWKYPDRENLRGNFIYEIAKTLGFNQAKRTLLKIQKKPHNPIKALLLDIIGYFMGGSSFVMDYVFSNGKNDIDSMYQLLEELLVKLNEGDKMIYLVIEDIDRSGDGGIFFIETLQYFLSKHESNIKVIVPISKKKYQEKYHEFTKILDNIYIKPHSKYNWNKFIKRTFKKEVRENLGGKLLADILSDGIDLYLAGNRHNIRTIKHILKSLNRDYIKYINTPGGEWIDLRFFLTIGLYYYFNFSFGYVELDLTLNNRNMTSDNIAYETYIPSIEAIIEADLAKNGKQVKTLKFSEDSFVQYKKSYTYHPQTKSFGINPLYKSLRRQGDNILLNL